MSESCFIVPCVKNTKNEDVPSKLFEDLWRISGNYEWTEQQYKIATDEGFLSSIDSIDAVFDKNGQLDARSFLNITGITFASDEIKERLSKKWEESSLPTEEVSDRVSKFNAEEELKDDFIPVITPNGDKFVKFTISQRTPNRSAELQTYLENNETVKVLTDRLKALGVAFDFVGKERYSGRFSTQNAQKAFDGLYHLIQIAQGGNIEDALVEESAHLATLACKDSTFINRILSLLDNEDTLNSLFTPEELAEADLMTSDGRLELAGKLVAKALRNQIDGGYKGFFERVKQSIYKVFSKTNLSSLLSKKQRAKVLAETLAHGFLFDKDSFSAEEAINKPSKTLYSIDNIPKENQVLKRTLNSIKRLGARVDNFTSGAYRDIYAKLNEKSLLKEDEDLASLEEQECLTYTASAVSSLMSRLQMLCNALTQNVTKDMFDKDINIEVLNTMFEALEIVKSLKELGDTFSAFKNSEYDVEDSFVNGISDLFNEITASVTSAEKSLNEYVRWYSIAILRETIGRDSIDLAADVVTRHWKNQKRKERHYSMAALATNYIEDLMDTSRVITFFRTRSNQKDVTTQVFYDMVRRSKAKEAIEYNNRIEKLEELEKEWKNYISDRDVRRIIKKYGFDPDTIFYERTKDGKLTGWFLGDIKKSQFKADEKKELLAVAERFRRDLESGVFPYSMADYRAMSKSEKRSLFDDYKNNDQRLQDFYNSAFSDRKSKIYANKYINQDFIDLCNRLPEFRELYDKIIKFKNLVDTRYLTEASVGDAGGVCHGVTGRLPQFKGSFINKLKNKRRDLSDTSDFSQYCLDATSKNFGSPITEPVALASEEEDYVELDKLPLYGINLLENPNDLSTNLFKSLDKYLEMACRYHQSQEVAIRLELFNAQLEKRQVGIAVSDRLLKKVNEAKSISSQQRQNILSNYVYLSSDKWLNFDENTWYGWALNRLTNWKPLVGVISAFGAIRALCGSWMAGAKNYAAALRIFTQDVASGIVEGVTLKDVVKQTLLNLNPVHFGGEIARTLSNNTWNFDHYQKLVDRWDSYRTPSKIRRHKGFLPLQTVVNILMANYSLTDNAVIGIIYNSMLNGHKVYDAINKKTINASKVYEFKNGNPKIRAGIIKNPRDARKWEVLNNARKELAKIMEANTAAEKDPTKQIRRVGDAGNTAIRALEDFYDFNNESLDDIYDGGPGIYKSAKDIDSILEKKMKEILYTEEDEYKICNGINDYIISSQGVYGMLNATQFQSDIYTQSLGKIKGYMFGYLQRNFFSNYSISGNQYKHAMWDTARLALYSIFSHKNLIINDNISGARYIAYTLALTHLPFAFKNKNLMKHMQRCGWDPDQLNRLANMCLGGWINLMLAILSRLLYRGNYKKIGQKIYERKGDLRLKRTWHGLNLLYPWMGKNKLITAGPLAPKRAIKVGNIYEPDSKAQQQFEDWEKAHYPKNPKDKSKGYFTPGSEEYNDRVESFNLKNTLYNKYDPLYYLAGAAYRLTRGVRDEGITLMNPIRFVSDLTQMGDYSQSIGYSSGALTILKGIMAATSSDKEDWRKWKDKEINFYLSKLGFTYDSTPDVGLDKVQPMDWYEKQEKIDRYSAQNSPLNAGEI